MYTHMYIYIYMCVYISIYIYPLYIYVYIHTVGFGRGQYRLPPAVLEEHLERISDFEATGERRLRPGRQRAKPAHKCTGVSPIYR